MNTVEKVRSAAALAGLTLAVSGAVAVMAPSAASAAGCSTEMSLRTGFAMCQGINGSFRAQVVCEKPTSGDVAFAYGAWVSRSGTSAGVCGATWRAIAVQVAYR